MEFEWLNIESVEDAVIKEFDCGNHAFNNFLYENAKAWNAAGESVTYVFADSEEVKNHSVKRIYGFNAISEFIAPQNDSGIDLLGCTPLILMITPDMVYNIFS